MTTRPSIPSPVEVKEWDTVIKGGAKLVFDQYLLELKHQRRVQTVNLCLNALGPILGFIVVMAFLGGSVLLVMNEHGVEGTVMATVDIVALAGVFVYGAHKSSQVSAADQPDIASQDRQNGSSSAAGA